MSILPQQPGPQWLMPTQPETLQISAALPTHLAIGWLALRHSACCSRQARLQLGAPCQPTMDVRKSLAGSWEDKDFSSEINTSMCVQVRIKSTWTIGSLKKQANYGKHHSKLANLDTYSKFISNPRHHLEPCGCCTFHVGVSKSTKIKWSPKLQMIEFIVFDHPSQ